MKRKAILWLIGWLLLICAALGLVAVKTFQVDPFFHFHKPNTAWYFYPLDNERSQNDGILRHFDYTGVITGTSMTENFKSSEAEELWGGAFVKVPCSGGTFREVNDNVVSALRYDPELRVVIRGLDMGKLMDDKDEIRLDLGEYPTYLYDDNVFNDVRYIFNRDVVFSRVYPMTKENGEPGFTPGITSFDRYANWMGRYTFGKDTLFPDGVKAVPAGEPVHLTEEQAEQTRENILQNVVATAREHPDVTFYCFIPPYSAQWWMEQLKAGTIYKQVEAERIAIEEILPCENIRLYSFNCLFDLTTDLNHYKDHLHYGEWVNSMILRWMHDDRYRLTADNYEAYLEEELRFYTEYDYTRMNGQPDYEDDARAAALLELMFGDTEARELDPDEEGLELRHAQVLEDQYEGKPGILCTGSLQRDYNNKELTAAEYMRDTDYVGFRWTIRDVSPYRWLAFYGRNVADHGQPTVCVYDESGELVAECRDKYREIDQQWKWYYLDLSKLSGEVTIIFNGGYVDSTGSPDSQYVFSDVKLY